MQTTTATDEPSPGHPERRRSLVYLPAAGVVVAGLLVWGAHWWTNPEVFVDDGSGWRGVPVPVTEAEFHVAVTWPSSYTTAAERLTFRGAPSASLAADSAAAQVRFSVCQAPVGEDHIGVVTGHLGTYCTSHEPITDNTTMRLQERDTVDYVVMTVKLSQPGETTVNQVELDYALDRGGLYRRGTDTVALDQTAQAR